MSYEIFQFLDLAHNRPGRPKAYILRGIGEHEGTSVSLSTTEVDGMVYQARQRLPKDPVKAFAEILDRRFSLAHHDRLAKEVA